MKVNKECLFDGKVLVLKLVELAEIEWPGPKPNAPAYSRTGSSEKAKSSKEATLQRKAGDQILDIVEHAVAAANKQHSSTLETFEALSKKIQRSFWESGTSFWTTWMSSSFVYI